MIRVCNSCGKKYRIDPEKMHKDEATFKCVGCGATITVRKPLPGELEAEQAAAGSQSKATSQTIENTVLTQPSSRKGFLGLRGKILIIFCLVPIAAMTFGSIMFLTRMLDLSDLITRESNQIVTELAESAIEEKAHDVAAEVKRFLDRHPELKKEDFNQNPELREIGIRKVGETGYTALVSKPTEGEPSAVWLHPSQKIIGVDVVKIMKKTLGKDYQRWFNIQEKAYRTGKEVSGYYMWVDKREKYMTMMPLEGTPFFATSTTYLDEFTRPVKRLQTRSEALSQEAVHVGLIILAVTILFVAILALFYGNRLSNSLTRLTEAADRMSVGDLNEEIDIKSKDEIGILAEAINRMQDSIRISLERLRRRRR
ncbi:MAG: HAMP domain-containing protein [Desulfobacteraceae bacterium]|jgi:HAMP domain-containing protein